MAIRIICDHCEQELVGDEGGIFTIVSKEFLFSAKNSSPLPQFKKLELQLCKECSEKILKMIKDKKLK